MNRLFYLLLWGCVLAQAAPRVAILPFQSDASLDSLQRQALGQKFSAALLQSNVYQILERAQMDAILQEQGFQQSGACDEANCQVQIGKLLSVDKLILGSLSLFDDIYVLNTSLVDVESGAVERSWFTKVRGSLSDVLEEGCPLAARQVIASELKLPFASDTLITGATRKKQDAAALAATEELRREQHREKRSELMRHTLWALSGLAVAGGLYGGIYQNEQANDAYDDYKALAGTDSETQKAMDDAWDKVERREDRRNRFYGLAAFGLAMGLGTTFFF